MTMNRFSQLWMPICLSLFLVSDYLYTQCDRKVMVDDYNNFYLGSQITTTDLGWTGDDTQCLAGDWSQMAKEASLVRINYFRRLSGVSTSVGLDTSLNQMCQEAALIMHRNNELSHNPSNSWDCWSEMGKTAASKSNLALGAHSVNALSLYMRDPGTNNYAVGHRRWILYSRAKDFGMGSTNRAHVLYVINNKQDAPEDLDFIAYPNRGYFPAPLVPDRWSFSIPGARYEETTIRMWDAEGNEIPVEKLELKYGFGDHTVVWEPESGKIDKFSEEDMSYEVRLDNVKVGDDMVTYSYMVQIAQPSHPPVCPGSKIWNEESCSCEVQQTTSVSEKSIAQDVFTISPNPGDHYIQIKWKESPDQRSRQQTVYTIIDAAGQNIRTRSVEESIISTYDLPDGLYFLRVSNKDFSGVQSFLIKH